MPKSSLFSKLQVRLKRLPRLDGPESTDEEDHEELGTGLDDEHIVDAAPKGAAERRRAVRFCEDPVVSSPSSPPTAAQPPPPPCPFPSSAALPPKPQSPQPVQAQPQAHQAQLINQQYGGDAMAQLNGWAADNEHSQPPRPIRSNRANLLLQQLRTIGPAERAQEKGRLAERNGAAVSPSQICVFLEHQGETKRSILPQNLRTVEQLKSLFLRSFAGLSAAQLQSAAVKVYIQKPNSPHGLFYELEELHDLEDQSVLRLFEQSPPSPAPPPLRPPRPSAIVEPLECLSEPEMMDWNGLAGGPREFAQLRPASVLGAGGGRRRRPPPGFDWSGHSSDSSCSAGGHYPKSGSSTPREDREETRRKVDQMERQLASLCSLVHSALLPRRDSGVDMEMAQLRAQILDAGRPDRMMSGNCSNSLADSTTSTLSNGTTSYCAAHKERSLSQVMAELVGLRSELDGLKREAQRNALNGHEMIQRALQQARGTASMAIGAHQVLSNGSSTLLERLANVQSALRAFEAHLENTRSAVLNSTRHLKLEEVDELTARLGAIGRETVDLKVEIPAIQGQMETQVRQTMEQLAMLCDKLPMVDGCLRRCKTLANLMVTMKKLAIIQDEERPMALPGGQMQQQRRTIPVRHISLRNCVTGMAQGQSANNNGSSSHPLDAILDELNANSTKGSQSQQHEKIGQNEISASFTLRLAATQTKPEGVW